MWAVYYRQAPAVELLLEKGADPDRQTTDSKKSYPKGTTALMIAANDCQEDLAGLLVKKNAKKELADTDGNTSETLARGKECGPVLRALGLKAAANSTLDALLKSIEAGKDINAPGVNGWAPLMWSVFYSDLPTTELLLEKGANPNLQSGEKFEAYEKGATALMIAAKGCLDAQVAALLKWKADPSLTDATGKTAADYARTSRCDSTLIKLGACADPEVDKTLKEIKAGKMNVNALGDWGWSPLMRAVFHQDVEAVKNLLALGADPNLQSTAGSTLKIARNPLPTGTSALMLAARLDQGELVDLLLRKGANPKLTDSTASTAQDYAFYGDSWTAQDALLDRTPLKKTYTQLTIGAFPTPGMDARSLAAKVQEAALATLAERKGFEKVELEEEGKKYDASTLLLRTEFTHLESSPLFGSPTAKFTLSLIDAATGHLERQQAFSLTTSVWYGDGSGRKQSFLGAIGSIIAEYALLATGKALPNEGTWEPNDGPSGHWQWAEQLTSYPTYRDEGFQLSDLRTQRIAVWPVSRLELDASMKKTVAKECGGQETYLTACSERLSARCLQLAPAGSLGEAAIRASLSKGADKAWLESENILPWAHARLLSKNKLGPAFESLAKHPCLNGIRYLVLPHGLQAVELTWTTGGPMGGWSTSTTNSSLGMAIIDLSIGRVVWNGAVFATPRSGKSIHENEKELFQNLEMMIRAGK